MNDLATDHVFNGLTSNSSLEDLCVAAVLAAGRAALSDLAETDRKCLATDAATVAYLADPETRSALESWLGSYRHDGDVLDGLTADPLAEVMAAAWLHYQAVVMQARDEARKAA